MLALQVVLKDGTHSLTLPSTLSTFLNYHLFPLYRKCIFLLLLDFVKLLVCHLDKNIESNVSLNPSPAKKLEENPIRSRLVKNELI